jgi:hypothetical protein
MLAWLLAQVLSEHVNIAWYGEAPKPDDGSLLGKSRRTLKSNRERDREIYFLIVSIVSIIWLQHEVASDASVVCQPCGWPIAGAIGQSSDQQG